MYLLQAEKHEAPKRNRSWWERTFERKRQQTETLGGVAEQIAFSSAGFLVNAIGGVLRAAVQKNPNTRPAAVDPEGMAQAKKDAVKRASNRTSGLCVQQRRLGQLVLSKPQACPRIDGSWIFGGRLENHTHQQAGNYENVVF